MMNETEGNTIDEWDRMNSEGSLGQKIRAYRELRGWTQKELGLKCGFSPISADVRIAQYEKNKKTPREEGRRVIAEALMINEGAFHGADLAICDNAIHALFDIEDFYGLRPVKIGSKYYLDMEGALGWDYCIDNEWNPEMFLKEWYENRDKFGSLPDRKKGRELYNRWRAEYSHEGNKAVVLDKDSIEADMDDIKEKLNQSSSSKSHLYYSLLTLDGESYSPEEAGYAINFLEENHLVDWNEQAVKAAKEYLKDCNFSRIDLIQRLSGKYGAMFTEEQAEYAVNKLEESGYVDWKDQAVNEAIEYLEHNPASKKKLVEQLTNSYPDPLEETEKETISAAGF